MGTVGQQNVKGDVIHDTSNRPRAGIFRFNVIATREGRRRG